jgi:hypothetical protein
VWRELTSNKKRSNCNCSCVRRACQIRSAARHGCRVVVSTWLHTADFHPIVRWRDRWDALFLLSCSQTKALSSLYAFLLHTKKKAYVPHLIILQFCRAAWESEPIFRLPWDTLASDSHTISAPTTLALSTHHLTISLSTHHTHHAPHTTTGEQEEPPRGPLRGPSSFVVPPPARLCLPRNHSSPTCSPLQHQPCHHHHHNFPPHAAVVVPGLGKPSPPSPCCPCCLRSSMPTALRTAGARFVA